MRGWKSSRLGDVCSFLNRGVSPKYVEHGGVAVLNQKCVRDHRVSYVLARRHDMMSKAVAPERFVRVGDVLVNSTGTGTLGRVAQVRTAPPEPTTVDSHVTIVRPLHGMFYNFFFGYMLVAIEDAIKEAGEGCGGQTELSRSTLAERFVVTYPDSQPEQQHIVAVLDEAFEGIAAAWTNAERNVRNARALFDTQLDRLFTSPGARCVPIGDVAEVFDGPHATPHTVAEGPIFLGIGALQDGRVNLGETRHVTPEDFRTWTRRVRPQADDVVFSYETRLGQAALIPRGLECCLGRRMGLVRVDPMRLDPRYFVYQYLAPPFQRFLASKTVRGATVDRIPVKDFPSFPVVVPPMAEQRRIADLIERVRDKCDALASVHARKLAALDELKRSLLHHAFTGRLTAPRPKPLRAAQRTRLMSPLDRHAGVLAIAHRIHVKHGRERTFGRVKAEKVAHLVEAHLGIDLGRRPLKDQAGPYDREQRRSVQRRARAAGYFVFEGSRDTGYHVRELPNFDALVERTRADLGDRYADVERLVELMLPMRMHHAEVFATTYAAWNNLLLNGRPATDADIVHEARENWHPRKLRIPPEHFLRTIAWMRRRSVTPSGTGKRVGDAPSADHS